MKILLEKLILIYFFIDRDELLQVIIHTLVYCVVLTSGNNREYMQLIHLMEAFQVVLDVDKSSVKIINSR